MKSKGYTLFEILVSVAIAGIFFAVVVGIISGTNTVPSKASCLAAGGKWSEGIQYGRVTQLCTYN